MIFDLEQDSLLGRVLRATKRDAWRRIYRKYRVAKREISKVYDSATFYGTGFYRVSLDGVEHVRNVDMRIEK